MNSNTATCPVCQSPIHNESGQSLRTSKNILACLDHFRDKRQEFLVCLSIDSGQRLIARRVVTIGTQDSALAHPREIFAAPLADRAASVIIAHNHPSGDATPSKKDIELTQQLVAAGIILGIPLRDHYIVAASRHFSFRSHHLI
ncbi:MAG TPA: JAB domain-containing protein [Candidatus Saccharimonadales bacterium]